MSTTHIRKLNEDDAWQIISRIPAHRASGVSKQFAHAIVSTHPALTLLGRFEVNRVT